MIIMGSIRIYKGMPPLTEEQLAEIYANAPKSDADIDYSDIPKTTPEEWARVKQRRLQKKKLKIAS